MSQSHFARVALFASTSLFALAATTLGATKLQPRGNGVDGLLVGAHRIPAAAVPGNPNAITSGLPPITLNVNSAGYTAGVLNTSGVPAGSYNHVTISTNWTAGSGGPYSNEANFALGTGTDPANAAPIYKFATNFSNGAANSTARTLNYSGYLYQPYTAGAPLSLFGLQEFDPSTATWANTTVTLEQVALPNVNAANAVQNGSINAGALGGGQAKFFKFNYDGGALTLSTEGSTATADTVLGIFNAAGGLEFVDDDGGTGALSSLPLLPGDLPAGDYYVGVVSYSAALVLDDGLTLTSSGSPAIANLVVNGISVPEPTTLAALGFVGMIVRRRR